MKIMINYDLLDKIGESKTGISLHRTTKVIALATSSQITLTLFLLSLLLPPEIIKEFFGIVLQTALLQISINLSFCFLLSKICKIISKEQLKQLSSQLKDIKLNTDVDLILNSYKYKTEYKFVNSEKDIDLVQKKYIMVPVIENGEEKEVSVLQEHAIGSKTYSLSIGEPTKQKVLKLALNPM